MTVKLKKPKAIVFDWDNTLVNTWPVIHKSLNLTYQAFDKEPMSLKEVMANVKYSLRDSFPKVFGDEWETARDVFYKHFEECHIKELEKIEGVDHFLNQLSEKDIILSLVSNKTGKYLRQEAEHLGWHGFFHRIVGAGDAKKDKPEVDPLHMALADTQFEIDESIWFVGDSEVDIKIAENAQCTGILLHFEQKPDHMKAVPHQVHPDFESLLKEISEFY